MHLPGAGAKSRYAVRYYHAPHRYSPPAWGAPPTEDPIASLGSASHSSQCPRLPYRAGCRDLSHAARRGLDYGSIPRAGSLALILRLHSSKSSSGAANPEPGMPRDTAAHAPHGLVGTTSTSSHFGFPNGTTWKSSLPVDKRADYSLPTSNHAPAAARADLPLDMTRVAVGNSLYTPFHKQQSTA